MARKSSVEMNGKIIDYEIFYMPSVFELMSRVKEALKDGWEPYGLPFFDGNGNVAQAMVKRAQEPSNDR